MNGKSDGLIPTVPILFVLLSIIVNFRNRTAKKGYGMEQVMEDIEGGNPGKTAFFSRSKQEYIYCVYEPVGINDWMIMLGQPENIVLGDAENIRFILRHFIIFETTVFLLYFVKGKRNWAVFNTY